MTLTGPNQVSIIGSGSEERRFPDAEENSRRDVPFDDPMGLAFGEQGSLLVANSSFLANERDHMVVFDVFVDDWAPASKKPMLCG